MRTKQFNEYFYSDETNELEKSDYTAFVRYNDKKGKDVDFCIKTTVENKLPLHIIALVTKLADKDVLLWPENMTMHISKGRNPEHNYCIFQFKELETATEVCRFLDLIKTGLVKFETDKYNFPTFDHDTDHTYYYDIQEQKHSDHNLDRKYFSVTAGTYKVLRVIDAILGVSYTTERFDCPDCELLFATHTLDLALVEVLDSTKENGLAYELSFDIKSDALKEKIISILEK